ncbi:hypothetical protein EGW08_014522 [Elysia chlorotica]|uniref:Uncharacterized protein n=1 Tax=Elysia chlorotica TaxID=188477 RepID=A0A3S1BCW4_ELYCH|nr:hypothetical protein EGW08_014522 [Elysia chlorotica]
MDPCHSVSLRSPALPSTVTVAHLIRNIEQLKNKDKLISQLEKDLGHQWVSAHQAALERAAVASCSDVSREGDAQAALPGPCAPPSVGVACGGQENLACGAPPSLYTLSSSSALPPKGSNELDPTEFSSRTPSSTDTIDSVEDVWSYPLDGFSLSKHDLRKALKESKERNKELVEKCRAYLHRTRELTAQNRAYKDSSVKLLEENKKMQELLEHSKLRCLQLSRAASEASAERTWAQHTSHIMEQARLELGEAHKAIAALKQACSEKDRRIELIQHRKKRRRLAGPQERSIGGETYFGYEEDNNSVDSSQSRSTLSDDDIWDDVMSREETERNYQRLMMEHLQLQKSHNLIQKQTGLMQDPQREEKCRQDLQEDLFQAQCRIEKMEMMLRELGEGEIKTLLKEREIILSNLRAAQRKIESNEQEKSELQQKLNEVSGRAEDLEFQLMEMEQQAEEEWQNPPCPEASVQNADANWEKDTQQQKQHQELRATSVEQQQQHGEGGGGHVTEREGGDGADQSDSQSEDEDEGEEASGTGEGARNTSALWLLLDSLAQQQNKLRLASASDTGSGMERIRADLASFLKGKGGEADSLLKRLDNVTKEDKDRREALEYMAHELQMKVISLQQEMDSPKAKQEQGKGQKSSKADNSMSTALAREKQENLELKAEIRKMSNSENMLAGTERKLREELNVWKTQYDRVKNQFDMHQKQGTPVRKDTAVQTTGNHSLASKTLSPPLAELTRKNSKDRKSRPRSGDDPTETKRRRSCYDVFSENDGPPTAPKLKAARSVGDLKLGASYLSTHNSEEILRSYNSIDLQSLPLGISEQDKENRHVAAMRDEQVRLKAENAHLRDQINKSVTEKCSAADADIGHHYQQNMLLEKIHQLNSETGMLRLENEALRARVRQQRASEDSGSDSGSVSQLAEMEECLENLREQLDAKEAAERQLRERLRHVESCAEEAEAAEMAARERFEDLMAREAENSRQVRQMQQTCIELKDILVDKEIMEQGLTDKVDFLQRAEAAATQRVDELEAENKELRAQVQEAARLADDFESVGAGGANQRELNKIQELKHQMTFLETDNKALQARVTELEENEETLRENWRKVAEVDFSRIQSLDEKVRTLENLNKQLKADVAEAQEYFVINTVTETTLAAELANSQYELPSASGGSGDQAPDTAQGAGTVDGEDVILSGMVRKDSEKRTLRDKLKTLERQLSDVAEKKNSTIENLQEKIVGLKENEIKLSETISEMEMTEREIRAKLALYESSEITVEKMLKYQNKIEELRTSQESLLDQLETMENQEMTLQEKMQEMERTLRGKIVTLEVEIKGFKQKELKDAGRIRELEKQEKELSEKTAQQAEKENGLYVKISSLMDELKAAKSKVESLREQLTDKEDKVRKAKLLEVKFLEIEMEFGKKMSDLSSKLRHKEEELRQKEVAHEEQVLALKEEILTKDKEHSSVVAGFEDQLSEKENEISLTVAKLNKKMNEVSGERDAFESQVSDLTTQNQRLKFRQTELDNEILTLKDDVYKLSSLETETQGKTSQLEESLQQEKGRAEEAENEVKILKEELVKEKQSIANLNQEICSLKAELSQKSKNIKDSLEKEKEFEKEKEIAENELKLKNGRISDLENELKERSEYVTELELKYEKIKFDSELIEKKLSEAEVEHERKQEEILNQFNSLKSAMSEKEKEFEEENGLLLSRCEKLESEVNSLKDAVAAKENDIEDLENENFAMKEQHSLQVASLEDQQKVLEEELRNKIMFLNTQLSQELETRESEKSALHNSSQREQSLSDEVCKLRKEVENHKKELVEKLSELELNNKEKCELSLQLSNMKHTIETVRHEFEIFREVATETENKLRTTISEKEALVDKLQADLSKAKNNLQQVELELSQKDNLVFAASSEKEKLAEENHREISKLLEENTVKEQLVQEHIQKSESAVLQCKQEHQTEVESLKQRLLEETEKSKRLEEEKQELHVHIEDLESQIQTLELYLSEVNFKLDSKSSQCRKREEELEMALSDQEKNMNEIQVLNEQLGRIKNELEKKKVEMAQRVTENSDSLSLVSAKQQELENARTELNKSFQDIEHYKEVVLNKENEIEAKDQEHQALLLKYDQLSIQYQERDNENKQIESKLTGYQFKLKEAENRYRELEAKCASLEVQLQERFSQAQQEEIILNLREAERQELADKVSDAEGKIYNLSREMEDYKKAAVEKQEKCQHLETVIDQLQGKISDMEHSINEKDKDYEVSNCNYVELNTAHEQLKAQLANYQSKFEEEKELSVKTEKELKWSKDITEKLKEKLINSEELLSIQSQQMSELNGKLQILQEALEKKESSQKDTESGLQTLEQQHLESKIECQNLKSKVAYFEDMSSRNQALRDQSEERVKDVELALDESRAEVLEAQNRLSDAEAHSSQVVSQLETIKTHLLSSQEQSRRLAEKIGKLEQDIDNLQSVNAQITESDALVRAQLTEKVTACENQEREIRELRETLAGSKGETMSALKTLRYERDSLLEKNTALEKNISICESKVSNLEQKTESLSFDRDQYLSKLNSLEEEKKSLEEKFNVVSVRNSQLENDGSGLQEELNVKEEEHSNLEKMYAELDKTAKELKSKVKEQETQIEKYNDERQTLESRLREAESMCKELRSDLDTVNEEMSSSAQNLIDLEDELKEKHSENETLKSHLESLEKKTAFSVEEKDHTERVRELQNEIDLLKKSDAENEEKLHTLEKELNAVREQEHMKSHRVSDLESREKELLEQMADIEATVIVPLENENQELKDEIGIVRQERDDAIAKASKWDEDDHEEDAQQAVEHAHKCLEDALMQRDELEKKVAILMEDMSTLEAERDFMSKKIADLHTSVEDMAEKCEVAEIEVERLRELERQTSVVEEAETSLMDQVLDLEARELQLSAELQVLKHKELSSVASQTEQVEDLTARLNYLEQKVEVLQDAEGRYMDKIFELEEVRASLQAKLMETKDITNADKESNLTVSSANENLRASTLVKSIASITLGQAPLEIQESDSTNDSIGATSAVIEAEESNAIGNGKGQTSDDISNIQRHNDELAKELEENTTKFEQMKMKLELLQDSEARLMERLMEVEENKAKESDEAKHAIETLKEENEFLAESVENYKQLYKEEKEKTNALHERVLEDSTIHHDLEEAREELSAMQCKIETMKAEHIEDMAEKDSHENELNTLLEQSQLQETDLEQQIIHLQATERTLQQRNSELEEKASEVQQQALNLEERLSCSEVRTNDLQQQTMSLEQRLSGSELRANELQQETDRLQESEGRLQHQVQILQERERDLEQQLQELDRQLQDQRRRLEEDHSSHSDSGVSGDGRKTRYDSFEKDLKRVRSPSPVIEENFSSQASISLSRPPTAKSPPQLTSEPALITCTVAPSPANSTHSSNPSRPSPAHSPSTVSHAPVAPPRPRGRRSRPTSIDSVSQEELLFLVEELQGREAVLKRRVLDLEAITDVDLPQRVEELERENKRLQETLLSRERLRASQQEREETYVSLSNPSYFYPGSDSNNNSCSDTNSSSASRGRGYSGTMLDKPGEVLQQRIKELEHLDTINRNQLSELERDREVLHEIARKDKAIIHDLNVRIRELQLSERSLKEQVTSLEVSESSLFSRCEDLDGTRTRLEDRVHELEVHERRLRELVRRLKLDEERWLGRSGGMETALGELSASESQLKRLLQDSEMEKGGLAERTAYMEARVRELETVEASLAQKVKLLQSSEANLQKKLSQLENSEAAAHSKAAELDVLNADLSQRLQAGLEERAMLAQHLQQMHGQIQELDRRLLASRDSELAYKQHVESLQKNESSLQKRVREFELREIDSQARVRELEQTQEILGDKMAALQRSENRLKYRVQELEGIGGQIPGELTPAQKQKVPQKLEDCQKRVVVLQSHVENLQSQLRENIKQSQQNLASKDGAQTIPVPVMELSQLRARSTLLEEATYQMEELERVNEELNNTILKLREGKGASGHEVEVEVLKRRLASYKACISKLKSSLSPGQATSLMDPEQDSGPDGETLPARDLRGLESERVLQSVRGLEGGKAKGLPRPSKHGLVTQESPMVQSKVASSASSAPLSLDLSFTEDSSTEMDQSKGSAKVTPAQEESHWRAIEARRVGTVAGSPRGGGATQPETVPPQPVLGNGKPGGEVTTSTPRPVVTGPGRGGNKIGGGVSTLETEEVTVNMNLQSESELSSHHSHFNKTFDTVPNDTDSSLSPVPPPRRGRKGNKGTTRGATANLARPHHNSVGEDGGAYDNSSSNESGVAENSEPPHLLTGAVVATTNQKLFFGNGQKKPLPHQSESGNNVANSGPASSNKQSRAPLASFGGQDSFYLPSASQDADSQEDDDAPPPPLPTSQPPGTEAHGEGSQGSASPKQAAEVRKDSLDTSTSGMSIRQRIAMIEKQLQSDQFDSKVDTDHELFWKTQAQESLKQVELLERDNKHMKEDLPPAYRRKEKINKLEKELEEKRRHINTLEIWLSSVDDLLRNKNKQTDREMVEQLQLDLTKLRSELKRVGFRPEGDSMDPAALRTELEHRDREIVSKRNEVQTLAQELRRCKDECRSIEGMRRTALDSLRTLEEEVVELQEKELQLTEAVEELDELKNRTEKTREVFEENLLLREKVHQGELELRRLRGLCDDFNNLSARYEELESHKEQAEKRLHPLQAQLERLARKCQQKDMLLLDLGDELKHNSFRQSRALDELQRMERGMNLEEYNTDFPPLTNGLNSQAPEPRRPHHSRSSSMEELDSHLNPFVTTRERRKRPTPYVNNRPRSADGILGSSGPDRNSPDYHHHAQQVGPFYQMPRRPMGLENVEGKFRVIADYDPSLFSQSGRPGLELELVEGDIVTITGPMDRTGYYEGEVKGRTGLVPANYLLPVQGYANRGVLPRPGVGGAHRSMSADHSADQSPEHILDMFNQLQQGTPAHRTQATRTSAAPQEARLPAYHHQRQASPTPDPPCNLHVREGDDGDGTFLLSWQPPKLDDHGCNNGLQVLGYMVYVDNQEYEQVPSAGLCQVVLEGLTPGQSHTLAVQALCGGGQTSPRAQLLFQGVLRTEGYSRSQDQADGKESGDRRQDREHDTDLSSLLDKVHHKRGHKRKVLALYDYSPDQESPGDFPYLELAFQAGDVLTVYGEARPDGFLHGEVDGRRGLIPACFVENVLESPRGVQRVPASGVESREMTV